MDHPALVAVARVIKIANRISCGRAGHVNSRGRSGCGLTWTVLDSDIAAGELRERSAPTAPAA